MTENSGLKICIVIPVNNESESLKKLIAQIRQKISMDILVIDDGSTDQSGEIARQNGAEVIVHQDKSGKGLSLREGFQYACDHGYDGVLTMDGDGQHLVEDIEQFTGSSYIAKDVIINGNRMDDAKHMPFVRKCTNQFMSWIISLACHKKIPDTQCGFRFIGADVLKNINLTSDAFEIETEILMKANKKKFAIYSVGISTVYQNEDSHINPARDTFKFFSYFFRELFSK